MARKFAGRLQMPSGPFGKVGMYNLFTMQRMGSLPLFSAPLLTSLILAAGVGLPTYSRATIATVTDWEGIVRQVAIGEARFSGARRVQNQLLSYGTASSENLTAYAATVGGTGVAPIVTAGFSLMYKGQNYAASRLIINKGASNTAADQSGIRVNSSGGNARAFSIILQSNTPFSYLAQIRVGTAGAAVVLITPVAQRFCVIATADGDSQNWINLRGSLGTSDFADILATAWQVEHVDGQTNTAAGDYVSVGVLAAPFQGAGIDGVQYFPNSNGNTVQNGVLVPGSGTPIPSATLLGFQQEEARTNLALFSEDFTNAAWVKTGVTVTPNTFLAPSGTVTADTLTATTPLATCLQAVTITAADQAVSCWVRRRTGVGAIQLSADGIAFTPIAVTGVFQRFQVTQTLGAGVVNAFFRIDVSGDEIDVWGAQYETTTNGKASSYIPTTAATVTRNFDNLSYQTAGNILDLAGTAYCEFAAITNSTGNTRLLGSGGGSAVTTLAFAGTTTTTIFDGTSATNSNADATMLNGLPHKVASNWGSGKSMCLSGTVPSSGAYDGALVGAVLSVANDGNGNLCLNGNIRNLNIYGTQVPQLQSLTT